MKGNTVININNFTQPTLFDYEFSKYYYNRGHDNFYKKNYDEAVKDFELAIELQPKNYEYIAALLVTLYHKRIYERAEDIFKPKENAENQ